MDFSYSLRNVILSFLIISVRHLLTEAMNAPPFCTEANNRCLLQETCNLKLEKKGEDNRWKIK